MCEQRDPGDGEVKISGLLVAGLDGARDVDRGGGATELAFEFPIIDRRL